jgi:hypothetical protein
MNTIIEHQRKMKMVKMMQRREKIKNEQIKKLEQHKKDQEKKKREEDEKKRKEAAEKKKQEEEKKKEPENKKEKDNTKENVDKKKKEESNKKEDAKKLIINNMNKTDVSKKNPPPKPIPNKTPTIPNIPKQVPSINRMPLQSQNNKPQIKNHIVRKIVNSLNIDHKKYSLYNRENVGKKNNDKLINCIMIHNNDKPFLYKKLFDKIVVQTYKKWKILYITNTTRENDIFKNKIVSHKKGDISLVQHYISGNILDDKISIIQMNNNIISDNDISGNVDISNNDISGNVDISNNDISGNVDISNNDISGNVDIIGKDDINDKHIMSEKDIIDNVTEKYCSKGDIYYLMDDTHSYIHNTLFEELNKEMKLTHSNPNIYNKKGVMIEVFAL